MKNIANLPVFVVSPIALLHPQRELQVLSSCSRGPCPVRKCRIDRTQAALNVLVREMEAGAVVCVVAFYVRSRRKWVVLRCPCIQIWVWCGTRSKPQPSASGVNSLKNTRRRESQRILGFDLASFMFLQGID